MNALETRVLRLIGEDITTPDVFADTETGLAQIRDSLNDAIEELCMATGHYRRRYYLGLLEERAIYRLNPQNDYMGWVVHVWDRENRRPLDKTDLRALSASYPDFLSSNGTQTHWYQPGWEHIGIYQRPGSKGKVLELDCLCIPKPYTHGLSPTALRANWERAAVERAVSDYHASRGDANRALDYYKRYLETAQLMALNPLGPERIWVFKGKEKES